MLVGGSNRVSLDINEYHWVGAIESVVNDFLLVENNPPSFSDKISAFFRQLLASFHYKMVFLNTSDTTNHNHTD